MGQENARKVIATVSAEKAAPRARRGEIRRFAAEANVTSFPDRTAEPVSLAGRPRGRPNRWRGSDASWVRLVASNCSPVA